VVVTKAPLRLALAMRAVSIPPEPRCSRIPMSKADRFPQRCSIAAPHPESHLIVPSSRGRCYPHMCLGASLADACLLRPPSAGLLADASVLWFLPVLYVQITMCTVVDRRYITNRFR
jgi:hypothetical protein